MHGHVSLLAHRFCPQSTLAKHYWTLSLQITAKKATWGSIIERRQPSWPVWELEWSWLHKHLPSYFLEVTRTCDFLCAFHLDNPMVGPSFTNFSIITSAQESWCFSFFKKNQLFSTFFTSNLLLFYKESYAACQRPATWLCTQDLHLRSFRAGSSNTLRGWGLGHHQQLLKYWQGYAVK